MFMSLIIHMLEACVAVLSVMLGWQVARQYKLEVESFAEEASTGIPVEGPNVVTQQGIANAAAKLKERKEPFFGKESLGLERTSAVSEKSLESEDSSAIFASEDSASAPALFTENGSESVEQASSALDILDDYIGGFFETAGKSEVEIKAFRSVDEQEVESYYRSDAGNDHISAIAPAVDLSKYKASTADAADQIPVLRTPIPESLITERFLEQMKELDEEVILVEDKQQVVARESVMSDKVVLAMLDEAKLVRTN